MDRVVPSQTRNFLIALALFALAALDSQLSLLLAQGSLTPPGAPAPTMKSLDQIEARTPVDASNTPGNVSFEYYITQPGSYYLTANVTGIAGKNAIGIAANNVTVDLNGFSIFGVSGLVSGVFVYNNLTNITVRNGTVTAWNRGVNSFANNCLFENLVVSGDGYGIQTSGSVTVRNCTIINNAYYGMEVDGPNSVIYDNVFVGNNTLNSAGNAAIYVTSAGNSIENNKITGSGPAGYGISIFSSTNVVVRNVVNGGGANNYSIGGSANDVGPIGSASTNASPWANISN